MALVYPITLHRNTLPPLFLATSCPSLQPKLELSCKPIAWEGAWPCYLVAR